MVSDRFQVYKELDWWKSGLSPRINLFVIRVEVYALIPFVPAIIFHSLFPYAFFIFVFFIVLEIKGYDMRTLMFRLRSRIAGKHRYVTNQNLMHKRLTNKK